MTGKQRIEALEAAERDLDVGIRHAIALKRLEMVAQRDRIRRQIAMLREDERQHMGGVGR